MGRRREARKWALQILYQNELVSGPIEESLKTFWENHSESEREFTERLVRGVIDHRDEIDSALRECSEHWSLERMNVVDRNLLRLGAFELRYHREIPPQVVINEAVEMAKQYGTSESSSFVNGILDRIYRSDREGNKAKTEGSQ